MEEGNLDFIYNRNLEELEELLAGIDRSGDFQTHGQMLCFLPKIEIDGVGVLSFPTPEAQAQQIANVAERAPFGRGEETILDTSVRNVWQLPPDRVQISGRGWEASFDQLTAAVAAGLGVAPGHMTVELYKFLLYDQGGFFKAHRDTEKDPGMFGTLVVSLPSFHEGGELIMRHTPNREVRASLQTDEVSHIAYAAFYCDCEHEVLPVTSGNRICLIYNLIRRNSGAPLSAPDYSEQTDQGARLVQEAFDAEDAPTKIVWLLEHQYSAAGLSFGALKGKDAAVADVLAEIAERADCAIHLGIVHIREYGSAYETGGRWSRYRDMDDPLEYEVTHVEDIEVSVDEWRALDGSSPNFGALSLDENEALPVGALDDEAPDEDRLTEATGNEGASYERIFHRAALVLWPNNRFGELLLDEGVSAAVPYLEQLVELAAGSPDKRAEAIRLGQQLIARWADQAPPSWTEQEPSLRIATIRAFRKLNDPELLEGFLQQVIFERYNGAENVALVESASDLGAARAATLFGKLFKRKGRSHGSECIHLLILIAKREKDDFSSQDSPWTPLLSHAADILGHMFEPSSEVEGDYPYARRTKGEKIGGPSLGWLLYLFAESPDAHALPVAVGHICNRAELFNARDVVLPALEIWRSLKRTDEQAPAEYSRLWEHVAESLLRRSEVAPEPPQDWAQPDVLPCVCASCSELQAFLRSPSEHVLRFRQRQELRSHLEDMIRKENLDVTRETYTRGSPHTLIITKTRTRHLALLKQYLADRRAMTELMEITPTSNAAVTAFYNRLEKATAKE